MDFIDKIQQISSNISKQLGHVHTEEATKTSMVMPFIQALGYNVFDPTEVVPEYIADVGTKKGEKVDYAILQDGKPIIIFECKSAGTKLGDVHTSQLYRYYTTTDVRFGVLTNGIEYWFFSDLEKPNVLDDKPFLMVNMLEVTDGQVEELKKFSKESFDVDHILTTASELKYTREIRKIIAQQLKEPDDEMVKLLAGRVYSGRMTQNTKEDFTVVVKNAFKQFLNSAIKDRLQSAIHETGESEVVNIEEMAEETTGETEEADGKRKIITTQDEIDGYFIVKSILREVIDVHRIAMRDTQSYCGILLDDNNRKPICRLHFNYAQYYLEVFDAEKNGERIAIESVDSIYQHADKIKTVVEHYG